MVMLVSLHVGAPLGAATSTTTSQLSRSHRSERAGVGSVLVGRTSGGGRTERVDSEPAGYIERCGTAYLSIDPGHPMFTGSAATRQPPAKLGTSRFSEVPRSGLHRGPLSDRRCARHVADWRLAKPRKCRLGGTHTSADRETTIRTTRSARDATRSADFHSSPAAERVVSRSPDYSSRSMNTTACTFTPQATVQSALAPKATSKPAPLRAKPTRRMPADSRT